MASQAPAKANKAMAKAVAKEVVKEEKKQQQPTPPKNSRRRRRQRGRPQQQKSRVDRQVTKHLKKEGLEGPRARFSVRVSATIGKIGPNKTQGPELQISTFLHPSLMKEPNDGTNFGPLQAAAAQWGLWRLADLKIICTPLVGASAVTGSVYRVSLNLTQSPGSTSWGGLGARKHVDVPVGRSNTWHLHRGDLAGPRQTWWMTDTNEEGGQSCGPMIEIHGLGKTSSTYKDADWSGDLFIVEVTGKWEFSNYNAKPALGTLERVTEDVAASIEVTSEGMIMTIPSNTELARHMGTGYERATNASTVGETIWQIVDEGAGLASTVAPPPFGWLIKGGWWFVKKLLGRASNDDEAFLVYASLADAQNNKPVEAPTFAKQTVQTVLASTQINAPNTGPNGAVVLTNSPSWPIRPVGVPPNQFVLLSRFAPGFLVATSRVPCYVTKGTSSTTSAAFRLSIGTGPSPFTGVVAGYYAKLNNPHVAMSFNPNGNLTGLYDLELLPEIGTLRVTSGLDPSATVTDTGGSVRAWTYWWPFGTTPSGPSPLFVAYLVKSTASWSPRDSTSWTATARVVYPSWMASGTWQDAPVSMAVAKTGLPKAYYGSTASSTPIAINTTMAPGDWMVVIAIGSANSIANGEPISWNPTTDSGDVNDKVYTSSMNEDPNGLSAFFPTTNVSASNTWTQWFTTTRDLFGPQQLLQLLMSHYRVEPRSPTPELDISSSSSDDESGNEDDDRTCAGDSPPGYDQAKEDGKRMSKQRLYEATRDLGWTHVSTEELLAEVLARRGHAE
nr:MAG: capsid protein precursor [Squirrel astrovirus 1]